MNMHRSIEEQVSVFESRLHAEQSIRWNQQPVVVRGACTAAWHYRGWLCLSTECFDGECAYYELIQTQDTEFARVVQDKAES